MASVAMLVGGALVNALAFSGSNYLFSMLRSQRTDEERTRHDKAIEQLQAAQADWSRKRTERLDWINQELRRQGHAEHTFRDVDAAIRQYNIIAAQGVTQAVPLEQEKEPTLSDFYSPSEDQKNREIAFTILGLGTSALVAYQLAK